jgi:hypothetical protein
MSRPEALSRPDVLSSWELPSNSGDLGYWFWFDEIRDGLAFARQRRIDEK